MIRSLGFAVLIRFDQWSLVGLRVFARCPDCGVRSEIVHSIDDYGYVSIICPHCLFKDWVLLEGWDLRG